MKLKRIRMVGFKSFADETIIETGAGITAVVGPNGCGKSNIMDAVRWVLGEKSARGLRGKSMDDVIFLGSEFRKQSGMAEVEMVFDNADRRLPIDLDEVMIGRRIFLASGSEYLLNGSRSTRREIEKVFMDTGIGKSAYSIMEQGRMSEILRASPEERRGLFDEAAGVSRFKAERKETTARLSDTEQNLMRLADILKGKESELKNLERQAEKTREYLGLKEDLDARDRNLRYVRLVEYRERKEKVDKKLTQLLGHRDEIFRRITATEQDLEAREKGAAGLTEEMHRLDRDYHQALAGLEGHQKNLARLEVEKKERSGKSENLNQRRRSEELLQRETRKKLEQSLQLELDLNTELENLTTNSDQLEERMGKIRIEIDESTEREEANKRELKSLAEKQDVLLEELKRTAQELIEELEEHKQELTQNESRLSSLREAIRNRLEDGGRLIDEALAALKQGKPEDAAYNLGRLELAHVLQDFEEHTGFEERFRSFLFGKTGLLSRKEDLDRRMDALHTRRDELQRENTALYESRKALASELESTQENKIEMDLRIRDSEVRKESSAEARESIELQLKDTQDRLKYYGEELDANRKAIEEMDQEVAAIKQRLKETEAANSEQARRIAELKGKIETSRNEIVQSRENTRRDREEVERILPQISEQERRAESVDVALVQVEEDLYNDFQLSPGELIEECKDLKFDKGAEELQFRTLKSRIKDLGQFNPLAIEELERARESYDEVIRQKKDIESARENIMKIIRDIDERSKSMFLETFESIQNNFSEVFQSLFGGGTAALSLMNVDDPLESGVDIMVQPPGKKNTSLSLLSGGEQNMTAIALMFATYLVRPSPFCFLDEIDAPLDDQNVERFLKMLGSFASRSQFLVITHNKLTMSRADGLFGVTQEELGVSKLVSVQLRQAQDLAG